MLIHFIVSNHFDFISKVTFMDSTTTCSACLNTVDSLLTPTISSLETISIEESSLSKPSASFWPIRSSTQRTSFCYEEITKVPLSIASTAFMTSASAVTASNFGKSSQTASIVFLSQLSSTRKFSACTVAYHLNSTES